MAASSPHLGDISSAELDEIYKFAIELGKNAGQRLMDGVHARIGGSISGISSDDANMTSNLAFTEKDSSVDIVTQVDEGSSFSFLLYESFVLYSVKASVLTHHFI
jgi:myo-inositol-1(or 4)-monophosphatase